MKNGDSGAGMELRGISGLLEVDAAADELGIPPLAVMRLIARGQIKATRLGADGDFRVNAANLRAYCDQGAPDFDAPAFDGGWFEDLILTNRPLPGALSTAVAVACAPAVPNDDQLRAQWDRRFTRNYEGQTLTQDVAVALTPEAAKLVSSLPKSFLPEGRKQLEPFGDWGTLYLADEMRNRVRGMLDFERSPELGGMNYLQKLYSSPDLYGRVVQKAREQVVTSIAAIIGRRIVALQDTRKDPVQVNFTFVVKNFPGIATKERLDRAIALAF